MNPVHRQRIRAIALSLVLLGSTFAAQAQVSGGTIYFVGEIVSSPFEISQKRNAPVQAATLSRGSDRATGELVFAPPPAERPSASVAVHPVGGHVLDMVFIDGQGRRSNLASNNHHAMGQDGGRLALLSTNRQPRPAAMVTVQYD